MHAIPSVSNAPPSSKEEIIQGALSTIQTTLDILKISPWSISRNENLRLLSSTLMSVLPIASPILSWLWKNPIHKSALLQSALLATAAVDSLSLFPRNLPCRLAIDGLFLTASLINSSQAVLARGKQIFHALNTPKKNRKATKILSGSVFVCLGLLSFFAACHTTIQLIQGLRLFNQLDSMQQQGVLKHRAIQELPSEKSCNAIILNGMNSQRGKIDDDIADPVNELLYRRCNTLYYDVSHEEEVCQALKEASSSFRSGTDILSINGHANNEHLVFNLKNITKQTVLSKYSVKIFQSMDKVLKKSAQILMNGCNTAFETEEITSLAREISNQVRGREVVGHAAFYVRLMVLVNFSNGKIKIDNLEGKAFNGTTAFPFNTRSYINGTQISGFAG